MENQFQYKVSVVVPVYNAEKYLSDCLGSLLMQTINSEDMEVLLINDGSTDHSPDICQKYEKLYPVFKYFTQENAGVSAARNRGIQEARGKYIMFLDSDDELTENTIESVTDFFDAHYSETDIVTYPERTYLSTGQVKPPHVRYKTLTQTGIYDAAENIYLFQVRLNVAVKNKKRNNILFDEEMGYHEDQKYCNEIIRSKMKLGFVDGCEYKYKLHDGNITDENTNPICLFEATTKYWEELFGSFKGEVPSYYQALYLHDLSWKLSQNCLLPYHYQGEQFEVAQQRLWKLLEYVNVDIIMKHPSVDNFHCFYFLEKKNVNAAAIVDPTKYYLVVEDQKIYENNKFELIFNKCRVVKNKLLIQCTLKSQYFNFHESPEVYVKENGVEYTKMSLYHSPMSYYRCKTITNNFLGFYYSCDMAEVSSFEFFVKIDGQLFETKYFIMPTSPFVINKAIVRGEYIIKMDQNKFSIFRANQSERKKVLDENDQHIQEKNKEAYHIRKLSACYADRKIWIYYDCKGVEWDNGYLQFIHDFDREDGIEKYYISNNDFDSVSYLFQEKHYPYIVEFGSSLHKQLFLRADKIITAYIEEVNIYPFDAANKRFYMDIMNMGILYLQHGILHASLPWKYTPEKIEVDKVLASSNFEIHNFTTKYCFRKEDVLPYGMPRFERIDRNQKAVNRILFAPSWRMYLIGECVNTVWNLTEDKFRNSNYFRVFQEFLNAPKLHEILEENDMHLDFKIHPIFRPYLSCFHIMSERVHIADNVVEDEEYSMFITDFSSYVFNFAYLGRPILYFVPDYMEFRAGLNQYRELDLPFEKGFGDFVEESEEAIEAIRRVAANRFEVEKKYRDRMDAFFIPMQDSCEKIYDYLREW